MSHDPASGRLASQEHADVLLLTGLHEELHWAQQIFGMDFERCVRQGTVYLRGEFRRGDRHQGDLPLAAEDGVDDRDLRWDSRRG